MTVGPPTPDYIDNRQMPPGAIEGAGQSWEVDHRPIGGLFRDRPIRRASRGTDYKQLDRRTDVRRMYEAHLDGCVCDILSLSGGGSFTRTLGIMDAVAQEGLVGKFFVMGMFDYTGLSIHKASVTTIVDMIVQLAVKPAQHYIGDRLQVTFFDPEATPFDSSIGARLPRKTVAYYQSVKDALVARGYKPDFTFCYVGDFVTYSEMYKAVADRHARWGARDPISSGGTANNLRGAAQYIWDKYGTPYMGNVSPGDVRPVTSRGNNWHEQRGTEQFRVSWDAALYGNRTAQGGSEWVQIITWNDWSETALISPSRNNGWAMVDLNKFFVAILKTGFVPGMSKDGLYLAHKTQFSSGMTYTTSTFTNPMERVGQTPAADIIEVLAFITDPVNTTVEITTGGTTTVKSGLKVGLNVLTVPIVKGGPNSVGAVVMRNGIEVTGTRLSSPWAVSHTAQVHDPSYRIGSSLRGWTSTYPTIIPNQSTIPIT